MHHITSTYYKQHLTVALYIQNISKAILYRLPMEHKGLAYHNSTHSKLHHMCLCHINTDLLRVEASAHCALAIQHMTRL